MTQQQHQRPFPGQVDQLATPVHHVDAPSVVPVGHAPASDTGPMAIWGRVLLILFWPQRLPLTLGRHFARPRPPSRGSHAQ